MKRFLIIFFSIAVIVFAIFMIVFLLNPNYFNSNEEYTSSIIKSEIGYTAVNIGNNFISYNIGHDLMSDFEFEINSASVKYLNDTLYINNNEIVSNILLYKYFALYDNSILVFIYTCLDDKMSGIAIYDIYNKNFSVVDRYDDMFIVFDDEIYFEDLGFVFIASRVIDNNVYMDNNKINICSIKDPNLIVKKGVEYQYDSNEHKFVRFEEVFVTSLDSYVTINKLCK